MSLHKQFATNHAKEVDGTWIDYGPNEDGTVPGFKLARMGKANKRYTKALDQATRPHRRAIELKALSEELSEKLLLDVFVVTVLLDWRNVQDKDGKPIAFNADNAKALFKELPELYEDLQDNAKQSALFRDEAVEEEVKN